MAEQADWEANTGLAPGTTKVALTCLKEQREQWTEEPAGTG